MPMREKPRYAGPGEEAVKNWKITNSAETLQASDVQDYANDTRELSMDIVEGVNKRIVESSNG